MVVDSMQRAAVLYRRVSSRTQDARSQFEPILRFCDENRLSVIADFAETGSGSNRKTMPKRDEAVAMAKAHDAFVVCWSADRFSREPLSDFPHWDCIESGRLLTVHDGSSEYRKAYRSLGWTMRAHNWLLHKCFPDTLRLPVLSCCDVRADQREEQITAMRFVWAVPKRSRHPLDIDNAYPVAIRSRSRERLYLHHRKARRITCPVDGPTIHAAAERWFFSDCDFREFFGDDRADRLIDREVSKAEAAITAGN
ncbi:recombinase family protein [Rhodopirellula sp. JC639]|uniref:recombinase family protein n=1 Tax=Stieleria mannarensis TaxID=2755585 RepID=UPI001601DB82|nr:recombinase family protein [Rhodopirellula sp. JC639]